MGNRLQQCVVLIIDDEKRDGRKCFEILRPFLLRQGIEVPRVLDDNSITDGCEQVKRERGCDIILLDIKGVDDDRTAIDQLRMVNAYVPIVMMSNQFGPDLVLDYQAAGARTFIAKDRLKPGSSSVNSQFASRRAFGGKRNAELEIVAGRLRKIIEEYQPIKDLLNRSIEGSGWVIKREPLDDDEPEDRVAYLKLLEESRCGKMFPKVEWQKKEGKDLIYQIPYFDLKTLRSVVLNGNQRNLCQQIVQETLRKVVDFLIAEMYITCREFGYKRLDASELISGRVVNRIEKMRRMATEELARAREANEAQVELQCHFLENLLGERDLWDQDSHKLKHPIHILRELSSDPVFSERLYPPFVSWVHGDLHFGNIMVDDKLPKAVRFRLIDPKGMRVWGALGFHDPAYDFGKILLSTSGYYDVIQAGYFDADTIVFNRCSLLPVDLVEMKLVEGYSRARITTRFQKYQSWTQAVLDEMALFFVNDVMAPSKYAAEDLDWLIRARFYEATHMLSATPVQRDVTRATAVFVRGVQLLNAFDNQYRAGQFPDRRSKRT